MILVCGATGMLGGMITKRLLDQGKKVRILVREGSDYRRFVDQGAEPVFGDLKDKASLVKACADVDTVVTTVNSAHRGGADNLEAIEQRGNFDLIDAAKEAGVGHFIFTSVFGVTPESPVPFFAAKARAVNHLKDSGMAWTVLAPNFFMDVWCKAVVGNRVKEEKPVVVVGEGSKRHSFVAAKDVAAFAVAAVENDAAKGDHINIGGASAVSWRDVVAAFERASGKRVAVESVPPKTEIPHLTVMQWNVMGVMEGYESVIPMDDTAKKYGVTPTSIDDFAKSFLAS